MTIPCVATVAGTDPSSGAGIQADIKTISATGSYAASILTVLVAQNTTGVQGIYDIEPAFVAQQWHSVFTDLDIQAIKIGMLYKESIIETVYEKVMQYPVNHLVIDPVMIAKNGTALLKPEAIQRMTETLFPLATLLTPNLMEAETLLGETIPDHVAMERAAIELGQRFQINVLIKGGHLTTKDASDVLYQINNQTCYWFQADRIHSKNTHGTGCSLSAAIASYLAQGNPLIDAIDKAKRYLTQAIIYGSQLSIGKGLGPVDHFYFLRGNHHVK